MMSRRKAKAWLERQCGPKSEHWPLPITERDTQNFPDHIQTASTHGSSTSPWNRMRRMVPEQNSYGVHYKIFTQNKSQRPILMTRIKKDRSFLPVWAMNMMA